MRESTSAITRSDGSVGFAQALAEAIVVPADTAPLRRRPADVISAVAAALLLIATMSRIDSPAGFERQLAELLNALPDAFSGLAAFLYRLGSVWFVALAVGVAALAGRRRLAATMGAAGLIAWVLGRVLLEVAGHRVRTGGIAVRVGDVQQYPVVRIGVAVAIMCAGAPYLTVLVRRISGAVVAYLVITAMYLGVGLPNDIAAGVLIGLVAGATVKAIVGSPAGRPSVAQVQRALTEIDIDVSDLHAAQHQPQGMTLFEASDGSGRGLHVQAYGRDERDALLFSKMWRFVWYQDSGPPPPLSRLQQVEHEAYVMLRAASAGVPVPTLLAAATAGPGTAVLLTARPDGRPAAQLTASELTDDVLDHAWRALVELRNARIAHGALDLDHLFVGTDGTVTMTGFDLGTTSEREAHLDADAARLLAATSAAVGQDRAIRAAVEQAGDAVVVAALPFVQAPVLTDATKHWFRRHRKALDELRTAAAEAVHVDVPATAQLERVKPVNVITAAFTFLGIYLLLGQLASFAELKERLGAAHWGWFAVALVASALTNVGFAAAYVGATTQKLPFGSTVALQAAGSFTDLVTPNGVGTTAMNVRFLQVRGVPLTSALASSMINSVASTIVNVGLFLALLPAAGTKFDVGRVPWRNLLGLAVLVIAVLGIVGALLWRAPRIRRLYDEQVRPALAGVRDVTRSPSKLALIFSGNLFVALLYGLTLTATCRMYGSNVSFASLLVVNIGVGYIVGLIPVPGSLGVGEAGLSAGLASVGVEPTTAVAVALTNRLVTSWLPTLPGWFAFRYLQHEKDV